MGQQPNTIAIVASSIDASLEDLAKEGPVWVVDTAANRRIGERYSEPEWDGARRIFGVSFVAVSLTLEASDIVGALLTRALEETDMTTVERVIVRGVDVNAPGILQSLSALGFHRFQVEVPVRRNTDGFTAVKRARASRHSA
jgi:hypothetical protein